ncbi:MAG: glycosyltransferase family 2 protein, partial [Nitrospira sp.]|nr:glycosyltransferase family 2 protein [Nitrospira sp.]
HIISSSPVTQVDITVVSDGSTDRTVELARKYVDQIHLIVFKENRGYGAAIKEAWEQSDADLLGFLDADGTCDPAFFSQLCNVVAGEAADVALGCRMNANSRMPWLRRMGNRLFASLLTVLSSSGVRDTASGMRVVRRQSLGKLLPLPDGLHFTPAMSARALMSKAVKIIEIDMPYYEREGESKLRPGRDGLRFMKAIMDAAFLYRPARPLALLGLFWLGVAITLMVMPTAYYLRDRSVQEWMIYRFVVSHLAGTLASLLFCASYLIQKMVKIALPDETHRNTRRSVLEWFFSRRLVWVVAPTLLVAGGLLVLPSFLELVRTGATYEHWSRFIAMSFCWSVAFILIVTWMVDYTLGLITAQLAFIRSARTSDKEGFRRSP